MNDASILTDHCDDWLMTFVVEFQEREPGAMYDGIKHGTHSYLWLKLN